MRHDEQYGWQHLLRDHTYSLEDRAQANELASENKRRKGYLSRLCKTLEELSNHSEITNSKNSGSKVQFAGHTVVFSNHSPVDVHARLPKRLLEIVATRDPPPAYKACVLTPVERPEIKNTAWIATTQEAPPPPPQARKISPALVQTDSA